MDISIKNFKPTIIGEISCVPGKIITVNIQNITDSTNVAKDVIVESNFVYNLSYELPSLLYPKKYNIVINCSDGAKELFNMNFIVDSSVLLVKLSGSVNVAENVCLDTNLQSNDSNIVNKNLIIDKDMDASYTLPNIFNGVSYKVKSKCYESIVVDDIYVSFGPEEMDAIQLIPSGRVGDEYIQVVAQKNTSVISEHRILLYDEEYFEVKSLYGTYPIDSLDIGRKGDVEIISHTPGRIDWRVHNIQIPVDKGWTGVLNVFKFKCIKDFDEYKSIEKI